MRKIFRAMKNKEFYKKVQIPKKDHSPVIRSSFLWPYIPLNLLIILLGPLRDKSNGVLSDHELFRRWGISAALVLALNIILSWAIDIRPYLNKRKGFYWRGSFIVVEKESSFGFHYLILHPGNNHRIRVKRKVYRAVRERDRILLERTCLGDIIKISKTSSGLHERIKHRNLLKESE